MEIVEITIVGPGSASVTTARLQIAPADLFVDLRTALLECPTFCTYTSYNFEFEGSICSDYEQIGSERRQFKLIEIPYTYASIREHTQRFQDLLRHPAKNLSIENWLKHLVESNKNTNATETIVTPLAFSVEEASQSECDAMDNSNSLVSSVVVRKSEHDPPTGSRRLQGDLIYLDVHLDKLTIVHITGTQAGFFVNKTRDGIFDPSCKLRTGHRSTTLAAVLMKCNQPFRTEFNKLLSETSTLHPLMQAPSPVPSACASVYASPKSNQHPMVYEGVKTERNWNDEFLVWIDQPGENTAEHALARFRNQYKTYADFVNSAIAGSVAVVQGEIAPLNINEPKSSHVYLHDNIFFSVAIDSRGFYAEHGGDFTAHKFALHDMHAAHLVSKILLSEVGDTKLHTLMSVVVDYAGVRLVCQAIIPGILNGGGSTLLFGSVDQSPEEADSPPSMAPHANKRDNQTFVELTEKLAERLHWSKSDVLDSQGNVIDSIALPMDCKGLSTSDGRTYLMDLVRITPRDANYPDMLSAVLRFELVNRWCHDVALDKVMKSASPNMGETKRSLDRVESVDSDGVIANVEEQCKSEPGEGHTSSTNPYVIAVADVEAEATAVKFNVNCMTQYRVASDSTEDLEKLKELAYSIHERAIPSILDDMLSFPISCIDGRATSNLFHSHGVNMRYLGRVHKSLIEKLFDKQPELCTTLATCLYREMLVRSCKHVLLSELRAIGASAPVAPVIVTFLNNLLQQQPRNKTRNTLWARITNEMVSRFSYVHDERVHCSPEPVVVLTAISRAVGLRMRCRNYDFSESGKGISVDDLLDLKPVPKYHLPHNIDTTSVFATARSKIANDDHASAHEILSQLIQVLCSVTGSIHPDLAEAFSMLSLIAYRCGDTVSAIDHSYRVIIIYERLYGSVDGELARAHSQHALFLMCGGFHQRALKHASKAKQMFEILGGSSYPETATAMLNIGVILMESGNPSGSLEIQLDGLSRLERAIGSNTVHLHLITAHHSVAFSYAVLRHFREAVQYEKRARIAAQELGNVELVAQCNNWLAMFTRGAVLAAKNDPQQITVKPTAAALCWIQQAKPTAFTPIKEVVYVNNETVRQLQQEVEENGRQEPSTGLDSEASKEPVSISNGYEGSAPEVIEGAR